MFSWYYLVNRIHRWILKAKIVKNRMVLWNSVIRAKLRLFYKILGLHHHLQHMHTSTIKFKVALRHCSYSICSLICLKIHLIRGTTRVKTSKEEARALMIAPTTESFRRLFHMIGTIINNHIRCFYIEILWPLVAAHACYI